MFRVCSGSRCVQGFVQGSADLFLGSLDRALHHGGLAASSGAAALVEAGIQDTGIHGFPVPGRGPCADDIFVDRPVASIEHTAITGVGFAQAVDEAALGQVADPVRKQEDMLPVCRDSCRQGICHHGLEGALPLPESLVLVQNPGNTRCDLLAGSSGLRSQIKLGHPTVDLTDRQESILRSVMDGLSNADIARQQGVAEITVKNHLSAIFNKLGVSNRSEAVAIALRKHLLKI